MSNDFFVIKSMTLGMLAMEYNMSVSVLKSLIKLYPDLEKDVSFFTCSVKHEGQKILPPVIIEKIVNTLGRPY